MSTEKALTPTTTPDITFPIVLDTPSYSSAVKANKDGIITPKATPDTSFPQRIVSDELISTSLDTQSRRIKGAFEFGKVGAIQIGNFEVGVSGDIRISPVGITGRNIDGDITFAIDATTGDATFRGTVAAGSLISGDLVLGGVGNGDGTMTIKDASGHSIIIGNNLGHHYYNISGEELVRVNDTGFHAYDNAGTEKFRLNESGIFAFGTAEDVIKIKDTPGGTIYGNIGFKGSANAFYLASTGGNHLYIFTTGSNTDATFGAVRDILIDAGNDVFVNTGGDFVLNGSVKTAIVKTSKGYNALYCTESPGVEFWDWCYLKSKPWWKFWSKREYIIDPLFLETIEGKLKFVPTTDKNIFQVWGTRKGYSTKRFARKTFEDYKRNNKFWSKAQTGLDIK